MTKAADLSARTSTSPPTYICSPTLFFLLSFFLYTFSWYFSSCVSLSSPFFLLLFSMLLFSVTFFLIFVFFLMCFSYNHLSKSRLIFSKTLKAATGTRLRYSYTVKTNWTVEIKVKRMIYTWGERDTI